MSLALRGRHLLVLDVVATIGAFLVSLGLRFDAPSPQFDQYLQSFAWFIPILVGCRVTAFILLRLYARAWRYASIDELIAVFIAVVSSSLVAYVALYIVVLTTPVASLGFPRSVAITDTVLMVAAAGAWRFAFRFVGVRRAGPRGMSAAISAVPTLVVGGGSAALSILREIAADRQLGFRPTGIVADDLHVGQLLMGVPVLGPLSRLADLVSQYGAEVVLLTLPSADGRTLRRLVREAERGGARCLTVPGVAEVVAGRVTMNALREIEIEDLLRRAPSRIDLAEVSQWLRGRSVLVTGAGGSIGSELSRQILRFGPSRLVLLGRGENSIFDIERSLRATSSQTEIVPVIQDIRDRAGLRRTFAQTQPAVVFHAAAHKHVHFMEQNPPEAVAVNVIGTLNVLETAAASDVRRLVFISSDKAVKPTSVMGATKRVGELLVQRAAIERELGYVSVRFGNVLSSRGSVVPIFRQQLERGEPITITHPDAMRFFMTIPEAVQLVLQAGVFGGRGDTFVLDMGDPVRIVQLARDLVALHGLDPDHDVEIRFTGPRPGEKLTEELFFDDEVPVPTAHEAIRRVATAHGALPALREDVAELASAATSGDRAAILHALQRIVPEYAPAELAADAASTT